MFESVGGYVSLGPGATGKRARNIVCKNYDESRRHDYYCMQQQINKG